MSCGKDSDDSAAAANPDHAPGEFLLNFKKSGNFFTTTAGLVLGSSPHGRTQPWYSKSLEPYVESTQFTAPVGTVAIKEADKLPEGNPDGVVDGYTVMIKKEDGYDPANNNWAYEMRDLVGKEMKDPMVPSMCIGCHAGGKKRDYFMGLTVQ